MASLTGAPQGRLTGGTPATPPSSVDPKHPPEACSLHRGAKIFQRSIIFTRSSSSSKASSSSIRKSLTSRTFEENDEPYGTGKMSLDALKYVDVDLILVHQGPQHSFFQASRDISLGQHGHPRSHLKDVRQPTFSIILRFILRQEGVRLLSCHVRLGRDQSDSDFNQISEISDIRF